MNSSLYTVPRAHPVLSRQWNITLDSVILRHGIPENTQQFFTWLLVLFVEKLTFETHKNTTMGAAILCPAVNISDVTNRTCMCDKSTKTCHEPSPFSSPSPFFFIVMLFSSKDRTSPWYKRNGWLGRKTPNYSLTGWTNMAAPWGVQIRSKKSTYADRSKTKRTAYGNTYLHIFNDDKARPLTKVPRRRWRLPFELGTKTKLKHLRIIICTFLTKIKSVIWLRYQDKNEACPLI